MIPSVLARWLGAVAVIAVLLILAMGTNLNAAIEAFRVLATASVHHAIARLVDRARHAFIRHGELQHFEARKTTITSRAERAAGRPHRERIGSEQ